jgi:hypothetical protein
LECNGRNGRLFNAIYSYLMEHVSFWSIPNSAINML